MIEDVSAVTACLKLKSRWKPSTRVAGLEAPRSQGHGLEDSSSDPCCRSLHRVVVNLHLDGV